MEMSMYQYEIYGLKISSYVRLYQLCTIDDDRKEDVSIRCQKTDTFIQKCINDGIKSGMNQERVWFYNDIGCFVIKGGREILIEPYNGVKDEDVASFILGWCISFIFMQRGISALHCSALNINQQAVIVSGRSGVGKSTIAMALLKKGYQYLADDIAMVDIENHFLISPGFPQQKVCRNQAEKMESEKLFYIDEKKDKFALNNREDFCNEPKELTTMFILDTYDGDKLKVEKLTGLSKWNQVINNLFLNDAYRELGLTLEEKNRCLKIAGHIEMYRILRPEGEDTVEDICTEIIGKVF